MPNTEVKGYYVDFKYNVNLLNRPVYRDQMKLLDPPEIKDVEEGFQKALVKKIGNSEVEKFGDAVPLGSMYIHPLFNKRVQQYGMTESLNAEHPLFALIKKERGLESEEEKNARLQKKQEETEALFLRRAILVQNDLNAQGDALVLGHHAAEKNLRREPPEERTAEDLVKGCFLTFTQAEEIEKAALDMANPAVQHPDERARKPGPKYMRLVKNYPLMPNYEAWATDMRQVAFDEAIHINPLNRDKKNHNREVVDGVNGIEKASLLWGVNERDMDGNPKLGLSFALMQKPKNAEEHR